MLVDNLKILLADHIEASLIVYGYHWCVEGSAFSMYHKLFGDIQKEYYSQVDTIAELIRSISEGHEYPNASVDITKLNKTIIANPIVGYKAISMCDEILKINNTLITQYIELLDISNKEGNINIISAYCTDRLEKLNKLNWVLIPHTK
jgi:DNA-binding ferritin-like protein